MKKIIFVLTIIILSLVANAQNLPEIGAQVWIEPGDTDEQIDGWFRTLAEHDMRVGRLFIIWNYIEPKPNEWDFSLYDKAFNAAERHGVKIIATFETNRRPAHRGDYYQLHGDKLEDTWERLNESKIYIEKVVTHWQNHPALESWMLTNEAQQGASFNQLAIDRYKRWLADKYLSIDILNKQWSTAFKSFDEIKPSAAWIEKGYWNWEPAFLDFHYFWQEHLAWWLEWIALEVRKHDSKTPIHAHSGGITGNLAVNSYDFPHWGKFTNTLGASIHPSWHFGLFTRDQFPLAVSLSNEIMRGASNPNPYWVTELQGGQNIFSGRAHPLTPTQNDIAQWTWISIANDADKVVYWILNNRSKGFETNEWSMLDFQSHPNERLKVAGEIAKIINQNKVLFTKAEKYQAPVTILLSLETMTHELYAPDDSRIARSRDAHTLSVYGYYNTLLEMGIPVNIRYIDDFDWNNQENHLLILPHSIVLSKEQADNITSFVERGNKILVSGLTGMVDETSESWVQREWPLKKVTGTNFKDCRLIGDSVSIEMFSKKQTLPGVYWCGELEPITSKVIGKQEARIAATKNQFGKGEAIFIPTTLGLSAWTSNNLPLANFLKDEYNDLFSPVPVRFSEKQDDAIIQTLQSEDKYVVVITSGKMESVELKLDIRRGLQYKVLWGNNQSVKNKIVSLRERETVVLVLE